MMRQAVYVLLDVWIIRTLWAFSMEWCMTATKKILIVEDEEDILWAVSKSLTRRNVDIDVHWATNGLQADEMLRQNRYDLVVSDICMPGRDGIELSMDIRKMYPHTKIILMTSCSHAEIMHRAGELREYTCVEKPFDIGHLRALVFEALGFDTSLDLERVFKGNCISRG